MSLTERFLPYRGAIRAVAGSGKSLLFVTEHPEGRPTALYRLDCESFALASDPLPCGGRALCLSGDSVWVAGTDGTLYTAPIAGGPPTAALTVGGDVPLVDLAPLADGRLAVGNGRRVLIAAIGDRTAAVAQELELPADASRLAADPTGRWLAVGSARGDVSVFSSEGRDDFLLSESSRLHEGTVTAIAFEPDELRFLSAGADRRLLSTLARGTLEPEDRGKGFNHEDAITAIAWVPGNRFVTVALDATVKTWPRSGGARPATLKDGIARARASAVVVAHERPRLVVACEDNTLRVVPIDAAGKLGEVSHRLGDALARARHELAEGGPDRREAALADLASAGDLASIELLAEQGRADPDPGLRLDAARKVGEADHPRAIPLLEGLLGHPDEAVRRLAFESLRRRAGPDDLRPIDLALATDRPEVGRLAVEALAPAARRDEQALDRLLAALDAKEWEVRRSAAEALESLDGPDAPDALLTALRAKAADLRRWALLRLLRRGLLGLPAAATALRRRVDDRDPDVRRVAFLLLLHTRPRLLHALRARDPDLARQLADLEAPDGGQGGTAPDSPGAEPAREEAGAAAKGKKKAKGAGKASEPATDAPKGDDLTPLLIAAASRSADSALRGARGLALLGDPRAFGLLLQLSREAEPSARVEVCRALAELKDPAAAGRLRSLLFDPAPEVRDAAFSAIAAIEAEDPLRAAAAGLDAEHEDVRRRGLNLLLVRARLAPPSSADDPAGRLLVRALNDGAPAIRAEAFKATLSLPVAGGGAGALRFARRSIHADVRREVLTEVLAQPNEPWAWDLLLEAFDDPDPTLRLDAFAAASAKARGLEALDAALGSRYADLRAKAVAGLVKKHTAAAQALLARALDDEDRDVRRQALDAVVLDDHRPTLLLALESPHADARARAGRALARHGERAALGPLVALAAAPEPPEAERRADWLQLADQALDGLAELGDPDAIVPVLPLLDSPHAALRKGAVRVLAWCASADAADALRQALSHADPEVKYRAAMGLAILGDAALAPLVDSGDGPKVLGEGDRLAVAAALGDAGEGRLVVALDAPKEADRRRALLVLLARELKAPRPDAGRLVAALSSQDARTRLVAADALQSAHDPAALLALIARLANDRGDEPAWTIPGATIDAMAALLVLAPPAVRARTASGPLRRLDLKAGEKVESFTLAWSAHARRFGSTVEGAGAPPAPTGPAIPAGALREQAFGAYVGLVRDQGARSAGRKKRKEAADPAAEAAASRVRRSAADRLRALAGADPTLAPAVVPVLVQALGDPGQEVRLAAFDHLRTLGLDPATLGAEALAAGHTDVGVRGLELLGAGGAGGADAEAGRSVLDRVMMTRKDGLAAEAAGLLAARIGRAAVASRTLGAASEPLRSIAVAWLAEAASEGDESARAALRGALESRYAAVRRAAALALADLKDPAAFEALARLLAAAVERPEQSRIVAAFEALGDPRAAGALIDRLEHDPAGTAPADLLLPAASRYRRPEDADRLLALMEREPRWRALAFDAVFAIGGHDQRVADPDDDRPEDRRWMESQHPRRDAILARLLDRCLTLGENRLVQRAIGPARWALGPEVDEPLSRAAALPDEGTRIAALQAVGWRFRKRSGPADPLLKALRHPDPTSQFLAAEGLALGKRGEGIGVLLSAVETLPNLSFRRAAVVALGELGDPRAFDLLARLAAEDDHALQDVAAEALGHLGRSGKAAEIFALLDRKSRGDAYTLSSAALKGLRWLGTREAWARIREVADGLEHAGNQLVALDLLAHDDEPSTRDLLLRHLRQGGASTFLVALRGARRLFGPDAIEPDEAAVQNPSGIVGASSVAWTTIQSRYDLPLGPPLDRLRERATPDRLFAVMPRCPAGAASAIGDILLDLPEPPLAEAREALGSDHAAAVAASARILGRARDRASGPAVAAALGRWTGQWARRREAIEREARGQHPRFSAIVDNRGLPECLAALAWAAGRLGVAAEGLAAVLDLELGANPSWTDRAVLRAAAEALLLFDDPPAPAIAALERLAREGPPALRGPAAEAVARLDPGRASGLAPDLLDDPVALDRLARPADTGLDPLLDASAGRLHAQGAAIPLLVARGRVAALAAAAEDRTLPDAARLGAVEGLSALATEEAEAHLRRVGLDDQADDALRKAAWRALRRSKRARNRPRMEVTP